jgi:transcriptional regulator with XRE-family HTH domain
MPISVHKVFDELLRERGDGHAFDIREHQEGFVNVGIDLGVHIHATKGHLRLSLHWGVVIAGRAISVTAARYKGTEHIAAFAPRTALDAMLWSTDMAEHLGDLIGQGVEIGAQLVTSHATADGPLDLQHPFSGNATLLPFRHGVRTHAEAPRELGLRDNSKYRQKGAVVHLDDYVHRRLSSVNHLLIARLQPVVDHKPMVETPKPELFSTFAQWLDAVRRSRNLTKKNIATVAGVSAQAVTRWFKGKGVDEAPLQLIADWAGTDYAHLRLLLEGKQLPGGKKRGPESAMRSPDAHRISRKLDLLASSPETLADIEAMVDHQLEKRAKQRKRG